MQVSAAETAQKLLRETFPPAADLRRDELLFQLYRTSEDATAMASAFHGRPWTGLGLRELFEHREMLPTLSPEGFSAIGPAYLDALLSDSPDAVAVRGDLQDYLLACLMPWPHQKEDVAELTAQRLRVLSDRQREAIGVALDVLAARGSTDAATVLKTWRGTSPFAD